MHAKPSRLAAVLRQAPAPWLVTALGTVASLVTAFGNLTTAQSAAVFSLATAAGVTVTAFMTRPVAVPVVTGAASVVLGDLAVFGLKLSSEQAGAVTAAVALLLGAFLHLAHVQYVMSEAVRHPLQVVDHGPPPLITGLGRDVRK